MALIEKARHIIAVLALLSSLCFANGAFGSNSMEYISIEKAAAAGLIKTRILGIGGYSGECVSVCLQSMRADTLYIRVEAGRKLPTEDTLLQNILVARELAVTIPPLDSVKVQVFGFCCMAHKHAPYKDAKFLVGTMASDFRLVELAQYLNKHNHEIPAMQHAVWCISDGNNIASITEDTFEKQQELRAAVAQLMHATVPWYSVSFKKDSSLCSGIPETLFAKIDYQVINTGFVDMILFDEKGTPLKVFFRYTPHNPDRYSYDIKLDVSAYTRGKYFLRMFQDGTLKTEKIIEL